MDVTEHGAGGGVVRVSSGEYPIGTLELHGGVRLHLEAGSVLRGSDDPADYRNAGAPHDALVVAHDAENVALTGEGCIDGNGLAFVDEERVIRPGSGGLDPDRFDARAGEGFMYRAGVDAGPLWPDPDRPERCVLVAGCENVTVRDVTIRDSPHWTLHLLGCAGVRVAGVRIDNDRRVPNSDGIDVDGSRDVTVSDCVVSTGDDAVCLKTNRHDDYAGPCENVAVTDCVLRSRSAGVKVGSETGRDVTDCTVSNCVIRDSNRGIGIQHRDEGDVRNLHFSGLTIETRLHPGNWWGQAEPVSVTPLPRTTDTDLGRVSDVRFSELSCRAEGGCRIHAGEGATVEGVELADVRLEMERPATADSMGGNLDLRPTETRISYVARDEPALEAVGIDDLHLDGLRVAWRDPPSYHRDAVRVEDAAGVRIDGFEGRQPHDGAAIRLVDTAAASVRDSTAVPGTATFLAVEGGEDGRLFVDNDLLDTEHAYDGPEAFFGRRANLA